MKTKLITRIYRSLQALRSNQKINNVEWIEKWSELNNYLPDGSGFDAGCEIDVENSNETKIIILFSFHHLNENGYYEGWTDHKLTCRPTFDGIDMKISGPNKNQIKDYLYDTFDYILNEEHDFTV
jgi:hypothetical protein